MSTLRIQISMDGMRKTITEKFNAVAAVIEAASGHLPEETSDELVRCSNELARWIECLNACREPKLQPEDFNDLSKKLTVVKLS